MTIIDKLKDLIEKGLSNEIIVFLKGLSEDERKSLIPVLKELNVYYSEFVDLATMAKSDKQWQVGHSYGSRARGEQGTALSIASFICLDKKGFEKGYFPAGMMKQDILDQILPWYVPSWFKQLLEDINRGNSYRLDYDLIMQLEATEYFTPSPELITTHLPALIYGTNFIEQRAYTAKEEFLLRYPDTLNKHFWYIFEYPTAIHTLNRYSETPTGWKDFILKFTGEGRLDRMRVLRESLLTANRNFNKILVGWFMDLFISLKPSEKELRTLQPALMTLLDAKQTISVSLALNFLKQLKDLDYNTFITHLSQIILSGTKSILTTALQLSETICKEHDEVRQPVCIHLCQIFLNKEKAIQLKAAKLITTYGFPASETLQHQLQLFSDTMLTDVRPLLLTNPVTVILADEELPDEVLLIGEHNLIQPVNTVEELIYFASQVFENNEPHHAELLPAALINLQDQITEDVLIQLRPALKRAANLHARPTNNMGQLDYQLTNFFLRYFKQSGYVGPRKIEDAIVNPYILLWQYALEKLEAKDTVPLLSTPTHTPGWIDPVVLVNRLSQYKDKKPDDLDLQIAICRCALEDTTAAIALTKQLLTGEYRDLLLFLLDKSAVTFKDGNAWIQAANRKGIDLPTGKIPSVYLHGNFNWSTESEPYLAYGTYNRETNDYNRIPSFRTSILIKFPAVEPLHETAPLLQEYLVNRAMFFSLSAADLQKILSLTPANPSLVLANIIKSYMPLSATYEVNETTVITAAITYLKDFLLPYTATAKLFIATCMLHPDKTIRALAAECWITGVSYKKLNSDKIGQIIGIHQSVEWAPLKRFTDLINEHMMQVSKQHNEALEILLSACIELLPDKPVKNLKTLLEIYTEVLAVNGHTITHPIVKERLKAWGSSAVLKKLVSKMNT